MIALYPYKIGSSGAKALQEALLASNIPTKRVKPDGRYKPKQNDLIINWGNSQQPTSWNYPFRMLNHPHHVGIASNKLKTFESLKLSGVTTPDWSVDIDEALAWLDEGHTVLCRDKLNGHSGEGIHIARVINEIEDAPLYVKYKKKRNEYRAHVFNGTVLSVQEKRRNTEVERNADQSLIRSHHNGWVFCRENVNVTQELKDIALASIYALGLDFGAVDVIYNQKENKYYVLEVNTAPGLEGTTLNEYVEAITNYYNNN